MIQKLKNPLEHCHLKFAANDKGEFEGYASVFNGVDSYRDTILPGAFAESIKAGTPKMFINHDSWGVPVGDWVNLSEDDTGLLVKGKIDMIHKDGPTVYSALKRGAMDGLSIGFRIPIGGAEESDEGTRIIGNIDLKEISVVNFPADGDARISVVKSDIESIDNFKDLEAILRDAGFSVSAAKVFMSRAKTLTQRDVGNDDESKNINDCTSEIIQMINKFQIGASRNG